MTDATTIYGALAATQAAAETFTPDLRIGWWHRRLTAPTVLFSILAVVALSVLWIATLDVIGAERDSARRAARASGRELLETYEAQVVRILREIDLTLKTLQYSHRLRGDGETALADLRRRELLPPELVFPVSILNAAGEVVATTGEATDPELLDPDFLHRARRTEVLSEGPPVWSGNDWRLVFGRGLSAPDGSDDGVALVEMEAAFFVSHYETAELGERGLLAVLGSDGVFRVRRSGERVVFGGRTDYDAVVSEDADPGGVEPVLAINPWDGVRRYTGGRELYDFPLAVVVGLSEDEQLAAAGVRTRTYLWRAAGLSALLLLVLATLGWMSWSLEELRRRERETRAAYARRVEHLAYHDDLTGLPNRSLLSRLLGDRLHHAGRYGGGLALLFLDLDRFKQINDTLGHDSGDALLREVALRLEGVLRESDTVARMGGDEFVVLLPGAEDDGAVASVARKVLSTLADPFVLLGEEYHVTVSVGISVFPRDGEDELTLMKNADTAMYAAKDAGRNTYRFFSWEMASAPQHSLRPVSGLPAALDDREPDRRRRPRRSPALAPDLVAEGGVAAG